ncbi:thioredoxin-like protein [Paraphysoderma sedebokerense]|nr:thioredoxin-like protein [Paraphysoderma sedebokerense]
MSSLRLLSAAVRTSALRRPSPASLGPLNICRPFSASSSLLSKAFIGKPAPQFTAQAVVDGKFKTVDLKDYKGKYVVLLFYPLDFTFVCPTEIISFNDRLEDFRKLNAEVLAISVDSEHSHLAWTQVPRKQGGLGSMKVPLVSDLTKNISRDYGVLKDEKFSLRGLFIIDQASNLRQITINDTAVGRNVDEALRLVEAYQFADKHGEVCPANWRKGDKTMKGDPVKSKEYFASVNQ